MPLQPLTETDLRPVWKPEPPEKYPSHGDPQVTDTDVQRLEREGISQVLIDWFAPHQGVYVSADLFVYYEEDNPKKKLAPDVFACFGVRKRFRTVYLTWEEGHGIDWALEIVSKGTWKRDLFKKPALYAERLGTREYYVFDPEGRYLPEPLMGFERQDGALVAKAPLQSGRFASPLLGLELGLVRVSDEPVQKKKPRYAWELHLYRPDGTRLLRAREALQHAEARAGQAEARAGQAEARAREAEERAREEASQRAALEETLRQAREELERLRQGPAGEGKRQKARGKRQK